MPKTDEGRFVKRFGGASVAVVTARDVRIRDFVEDARKKPNEIEKGRAGDPRSLSAASDARMCGGGTGCSASSSAAAG